MVDGVTRTLLHGVHPEEDSVGDHVTMTVDVEAPAGLVLALANQVGAGAPVEASLAPAPWLALKKADLGGKVEVMVASEEMVAMETSRAIMIVMRAEAVRSKGVEAPERVAASEMVVAEVAVVVAGQVVGEVHLWRAPAPQQAQPLTGAPRAAPPWAPPFPITSWCGFRQRVPALHHRRVRVPWTVLGVVGASASRWVASLASGVAVWYRTGTETYPPM